MNDSEKFNETLLPEKGDFCSHLNMEDVTDANHRLAFKKVKFIECLNLIKTLGFKTIY